MKTSVKKRWAGHICALLVFICLFSLLPSPALAAGPETACPAGIVIDCGSGTVLAQKNADVLRSQASLTKMMTAYIVYEELEAGALTPETVIPVSDNAYYTSLEYDPSATLPQGGEIALDELLSLILVPSHNTASLMAAEYIAGSEEAFVRRMNETAASLGLRAEYYNSNGWNPNYITARSAALLCREFIGRFPAVLDYTSRRSVPFGGGALKSTNLLYSTYPYEGADGFKTGTSSTAGACFCATAVRGGRRLICVVMGGKSDYDRFTDARALLDYGFAQAADWHDRETGYADVSVTWYTESLAALDTLGAELSAEGIFFRPRENITRGEFIAMLVSAMEKSAVPFPTGSGEKYEFTDISGSPYEGYINTAADCGMVTGYGGGVFGLGDPLTREQVLIIAENAGLLTGEEQAIPFTDAADVSEWAVPAVQKGASAGIIDGYEDGSFKPLNSCTRAEALVIVTRILDLF